MQERLNVVPWVVEVVPLASQIPLAQLVRTNVWKVNFITFSLMHVKNVDWERILKGLHLFVRPARWVVMLTNSDQRLVQLVQLGGRLRIRERLHAMRANLDMNRLVINVCHNATVDTFVLVLNAQLVLLELMQLKDHLYVPHVQRVVPHPKRDQHTVIFVCQDIVCIMESVLGIFPSK